MIDIKVYGTSTAGQQVVVAALNKYLELAKIPYALTEENRVSVFLRLGLGFIPAIQYQAQTIALNYQGAFNKSLRAAIKHILRENDYGELRKIIIPLDFSAVSNNAFAYGHRLATDIGAVTKALHVYAPDARDFQHSQPTTTDYLSARRAQLKSFVETFDKDWGSDLMQTAFVEEEFRQGFPAEEILTSVEDNRAELIVMGNTGATNQLKTWFGSVSTKVMSQAACPVLLVPESTYYRKIKQIIYAYHDEVLDGTAIEKLLAFNAPIKATIHLVHVRDASSTTDHGARLSAQISTLQPGVSLVQASLPAGDLIARLNNYAAKQAIDVIAMTTSNRSFLQRLTHPSKTEKMAVQSSLPLLVLH